MILLAKGLAPEGHYVDGASLRLGVDLLDEVEWRVARPHVLA